MSQSKKPLPEGIDIRYTEADDGKYLKEWLMDPETRRWFPMDDEAEVDDAVMRWIAFYRYKCSLTITKDNIPCGISTLYLQPYRKLAHQCEFGIIIGRDYRSMGIGTYLMKNLIHLAKDKFKIELLHLQAYAGNPAIKMYEQFGFVEFGRQNSWIKEKEGYAGRVFMEKFI